MSYGNVDEAALGTWEVRGGRVVFSTPPQKALIYALTTSTGTTPTGEVVVRLGEDARLMSGLRVTLVGDAPTMAVGRPGRYGWTARVPGPVRHIVLTSTEQGSLPPAVIAVPAAQALEGTFILTLDPAWRPSMDFNVDMAATPGALEWQRDGSTLRYEKSGAK